MESSTDRVAVHLSLGQGGVQVQLKTEQPVLPSVEDLPVPAALSELSSTAPEAALPEPVAGIPSDPDSEPAPKPASEPSLVKAIVEEEPTPSTSEDPIAEPSLEVPTQDEPVPAASQSVALEPPAVEESNAEPSAKAEVSSPSTSAVAASEVPVLAAADSPVAGSAGTREQPNSPSSRQILSGSLSPRAEYGASPPASPTQRSRPLVRSLP